MNKTDEKAVKWAIKKYWKQKTDQQIADGLKKSVEEIRVMREELGIERKTESLKDFARRYILEMPEKEKMEFIRRLPADLVWKMAEGNPHSTEDQTVVHVLPTPILDLGTVPSVPRLNSPTPAE